MLNAVFYLNITSGFEKNTNKICCRRQFCSHLATNLILWWKSHIWMRCWLKMCIFQTAESHNIIKWILEWCTKGVCHKSCQCSFVSSFPR